MNLVLLLDIINLIIHKNVQFDLSVSFIIHICNLFKKLNQENKLYILF